MGKKLVKFHEHYKVGSQLVTPLNMLFKNIELMEWHHDRLPEYLWAGLTLFFLISLEMVHIIYQLFI